MKSWVKFYTESLHDRKIRKLSERDQLVFFKLVLLAGYEDLDGVLPSIEDISLELYLKESEIKKSLHNLLDAGLLYQNEDNVFVVTNFEKRQNANMSEAERAKKYRENKKTSRTNVTTVTQTSHGIANNQSDADQEIVTVEEDIEEEREKEKNKKEKREEREKRENVTQASRTLAKPTKHRHGNFQHVFLTDDEFQRLQDDIGQDKTTEYIQKLDDYLENNPKKSYANHNLTIRNWLNKDAKEPQTTFVKPQPKEETWLEVAERIQRERDAQKNVVDV